MASLKGAATFQQHLIVARRRCGPRISDPVFFKRSWKSALFFEIVSFLNVANIFFISHLKCGAHQSASGL